MKKISIWISFDKDFNLYLFKKEITDCSTIEKRLKTLDRIQLK